MSRLLEGRTVTDDGDNDADDDQRAERDGLLTTNERTLHNRFPHIIVDWIDSFYISGFLFVYCIWQRSQ